MTTAKFYQNYLRKHFIGDTKENLISVGAGIMTISPEFEEDSEDFAYYDLDGGTSKFTKSVKVSYAFEGHRMYGDKSQDYMRNKLFKLNERVCYLKVVEPDGTVIEGPAKISDITAHGGEATSPAEFKCTVTFEGLPKESQEKNVEEADKSQTTKNK